MTAGDSVSVAENFSAGFNDFNSPRGGLSGFRLPRRCPTIMLASRHSENRRQILQKWAFSFMLDYSKSWSGGALQQSLDHSWHLQQRVVVQVLLEFHNEQDLQYTVDMGPWSIQSAVFIVSPFKNTVICAPLHKIHVWVQVWGLPLEYHTSSTANLMGDVIGGFLDYEVALENVGFLRVIATIDPALPLIMECHIQFEDSQNPYSHKETEWVQFQYERIFRVCCACGRIGHVEQECDWDAFFDRLSYGSSSC